MKNDAEALCRPLASGVSLLTNEATGRAAGYRVAGTMPGPTALVTGHRATVAPAFERLVRIPTLPYLRGKLILAFIDEMDAQGRWRSARAIADETYDGSIFIAYEAVESTPHDVLSRARQDAYWTALRLCARLGMIAGRGIPAPAVAIDDANDRVAV